MRPARLASAAIALLLGWTPMMTGASPAAGPAAVLSPLPAPVAGAEVFPRPADGVYDLVGAGFGHGKGMSQYGAHGAALAGLTAAQILAFYYPGTKLVSAAPSTIRIGITTDNDGVLTVAARPGLAVTIAGTRAVLPAGPTQWRVRSAGATAQSCVVESRTAGTWSAYRSGRLCPVSFSTTGGSVDVLLPSDRRVYRGAVTAVWRSSTAIATVNTLPMQSYLRSVVPAEMPSTWSAAALQAQAVAARTFAARGVNRTAWYDTCDTTACQVYKGMGSRSSTGAFTSYERASTDAAVTATNGRVLTFAFADGVTRLATTMYSSSNGGWAAAAGNGHDYLPAHPDPYDAVSINPRRSWQAQLPVTVLEARFGIARVERVQILSRDGKGSWGGRVLDVLVEGRTAAGRYLSVKTDGAALRLARPWPTNAKGLSSTYFTFTGGPTPPAAPVTRIAGADRFATAAQLSAGRAPGIPVVYVSSGLDFPDALAAAARAARDGAPLLLTKPDSVPTRTAAEMTRLRAAKVVVLGGPSVLSAGVAESLRSRTTGGVVERVAGADRYATAAAVSATYPAGTPVVYLASGEAFPDALTAAAVAGRDKAPVLLTRATTLPAATTAALRRLSPQRVVVVGGPAAISDSVLAQARSYTTARAAKRLHGADRYATAAAVAAEFRPGATVYVASGSQFPDGLAAAARAGHEGVPVLLSRPTDLPGATQSQLRRLGPASARLVGGTGSLSAAVLAAVRAAIN